MLSSRNIKFLVVAGTFTIVSTAYVLHAKTFYNELYPEVNNAHSLILKKEKLNVKSEALVVEKIIKPKIDIEVVEKIVDNSTKNREKIQSTTLSNDDKLKQIFKVHKYLHVDKSGELSEQSKKILDEIIPLLSSIDYSYIELEGHSASQMYYNLTLEESKKSAQSVYDYLVKYVRNKKIIITGYGDLYPILEDKKDIRNSRVELKIRRR